MLYYVSINNKIHIDVQKLINYINMHYTQNIKN